MSVLRRTLYENYDYRRRSACYHSRRAGRFCSERDVQCRADDESRPNVIGCARCDEEPDAEEIDDAKDEKESDADEFDDAGAQGNVTIGLSFDVRCAQGARGEPRAPYGLAAFSCC
jgi:hypothetical protein